MTHLYLVRHGESFSNVDHRHSGRPPGPPLTARGRLQAEAAASILAASVPAPALVVSSPLLRALQTAQALAARLAGGVRVEGDLREVGFGRWEGLDDAALMGVEGYAEYHRDPEGHPPPGGERLSEIRVRMTRCLDALARLGAGGAIAAFSHYDPMLAFYMHVTGGDYRDRQELSLSNVAIAHFRHDGQKWHFLGVDRRASLAGAEREATS
jgi:broad specificity phosphatase PhoE